MPSPSRALPIALQPVSYVTRLQQRALDAVDQVVIHCTELPTRALAREYAERILYPDSGTGACGHYYVDTDGSLAEFVPVERVAHHCVGYNARSIGIELDHPGRWPQWLHAQQPHLNTPYPDAQIEALLGLMQHLVVRCPGLRWMAGHEELDSRLVPATDDPTVCVPRKRDPGPMFPWSWVERTMAGSLLHQVRSP